MSQTRNYILRLSSQKWVIGSKNMSSSLLLEVFAKLLSKIVIYNKRGTGREIYPNSSDFCFIFSFSHWYFKRPSIFLHIWLSLHVRLAIMYLFASCDFCKSYDLLYMWYQASLEIFATPWTVARQAPLSMGFPRPEYWSGSSCPPPGYLPNPGIKPTSLTSPALAGRLFTTDPPGMPTEVQAQGSLSWLHRHGVQVVGKGFEPWGQSWAGFRELVGNRSKGKAEIQGL